MSYYMRYFVADNKPINLSCIDQGLKDVDPAYVLEPTSGSLANSDNAELYYDDQLLGVLTILRAGDRTFDAEIGRFQRSLRDAEESDELEYVRDILDQTQALVALQVPAHEGDSEETLAAIDPFWTYLFDAYDGLLQADGEGFYDNSRLLVNEHGVPPREKEDAGTTDDEDVYEDELDEWQTFDIDDEELER